ncbi:hypothetical protein IB242_09135 [Xanthomonas sp. XNM01]|nr:hypothetical protein [Xanthomonas sp. XNM01]
MPRIDLQVQPASEPTPAAGWYLCFGYSTKPMVLYAQAGQTVWREILRIVPITHYAGPLPAGGRA